MTTQSVAVGELLGGQMATHWARDVDPENVLGEYPRPQMVRESWLNLNGQWDYAITDTADMPKKFDGKILVPFPVESSLSGVKRRVLPNQFLWYRRTFNVPSDTRTLLHFGAVDWECVVFVNGKSIGQHRGGYDPFSFELPATLNETGPQELLVRVSDPTDTASQPRKTQVLNPRSIWYTSITGIWQTVWLEPVPKDSIQKLKITPDVTAGVVRIAATITGNGAGMSLIVNGAVSGKGPADAPLVVNVPSPKLWSPDSPHLYEITVRLEQDSQVLDEVKTYFAMRSISVGMDADGNPRMFLNGKPLFQLGPLDQGFWPDGLYTAPTDAALRSDIETMKRLGFNMVRKHVKVEPDRWYYWCDRLGLLVWQDMPSGMIDCTPVHAIQPDAADAEFTREQADIFKTELAAMMDALHNHPCIVVWVPFNEGWGQHHSGAILEWAKQRDPSRLVDGPSGWTDRGVGDLHDKHAYPDPQMFPVTEAGRVSVLGEFGGLGIPPVEGHIWSQKENWTYATFQTQSELGEKYEQLFLKLVPLIKQGLAAAVYTQLTDVEGEVNGVLTYDRAVVKFDVAKLAALHRKIIQGVTIGDKR